MKNHIKLTNFLFFILCFIFCLGAEDQKNIKNQNENEITFDNLQTPDSPGFVLLGISPTSISRPGTPTDLAFTILSNTNYVSTIPKNFSVEFSPYWIFSGKGLPYEEYRKENLFGNFLHTLSISIATNTITENEIESTSLGIGIRFSLIKGKQTDIDDFFKTSDLENLFQSKYLPKIMSVEQENIAPKEKSIKEANIKTDYDEEANVLYKKWKDNIKNNNIRFLYSGFKWDMAGGIVIDFPGRDFDQDKFEKWGIWTTLGYEKKRITGLVVGRILKNVGEGKKPSIDLGGRFIYDTNNKITLSGELLARFNSIDVGNSTTQWRYVTNMEYIVGKNQKLNFSLGRDFKGARTGNLISMINFILGIGSTRPVTSKPVVK